MHIDDELVRKFFNRECNEDEARLVAGWLKDHPHLAELYYKESDWANERGVELPEADLMWKELSSRTKKKAPVKRIGYALAAAACLLALCTWFLMTDKTPVDQLAGLRREATADSMEIRNDGDTSIDRTLPDGTAVKLLPHSIARFSRTQWNTSREVQVDGEIVFHVAKDEGRPFIAYCNNVAVQALGTVFSVKEDRRNSVVNVRLYEGKVVVKPSGRSGEKVRRHFTSFLVPGQELTVPLSTYVPHVQYFLQGEKRAMSVRSGKRGDMPVVKPTGWYEFSNQSLEDVFTTLEVLHGIRIHYNKATLEGLYFIGRFEPEDSIDHVLRTIAVLNDLEVTKRSGKNYYITKKG